MKLLDYEVLRQYVSNNNADNLFSTIPTTTFALASTPASGKGNEQKSYTARHCPPAMMLRVVTEWYPSGNRMVTEWYAKRQGISQSHRDISIPSLFKNDNFNNSFAGKTYAKRSFEPSGEIRTHPSEK